MNDEEKITIRRVSDMERLCDKYKKPQFSGFLNEAEVALIKKNTTISKEFNVGFFGGYTDAERKILGIFPQWEDCSEDEFPISVIEAKNKYKRALTHRDYLGTCLSLGLERSKIGDICTTEDGAFIFVMEDISDYIVDNIKKIANCGVNLKKTDISHITIPEREFEYVDVVSASVRLDAVVASAVNISRKASEELILSGRVSVNHVATENTSHTLKPQDIVSVRGSGRLIIDEIGNTTRSGRLHIRIKKYVR